MLSRGMNRRQAGRALTALVTSVAALTSLGLSRPVHAADPVVFSFATVGDSRQDPNAPDQTTLLPNLTGSLLPQDAQWLTNTKAFSRILRTIQSEKPQLLFFNGDMIYGYGRPTVPPQWASAPPTTVSQIMKSDVAFEYTQYAYWRGMIGSMFETGTYVIPVPGNHETQCSVTSNVPATCGKIAYQENENAYRANMGDLVEDLVTNERFQTVTGVTASNVTGLTADTAPVSSPNNGPITGPQQEMSYSFDIQTSAGLLHFTTINTDPSGADETAPSDWVEADLAAAKARGASKFFVFGHKPAFSDLSTSSRNAFWSVIAKYNATYFCGHEHILAITQHADPTGVNKGSPYQVIVGSGGSPFSTTLTGSAPNFMEPVMSHPWNRFYGWALVQVHQSGAVTLTGEGFSDTYGPTEVVYSIPNLQ